VYVKTDLHGHTLFSDGRDSPEEYVEFRRARGLKIVAITDHDVLAGVPRGAAAAARAGLIFVPAVEVTAFLHFGTPRGEQFHLLAYFPPAYATPPRLRATALYRRGLVVQERWKAFALAWVDALPPDDRAALDPDGALAALPAGEFPALQSFINLVTARRRPLFEALRDHHWRFWEDDRELFGWEPEEAMDLIRADGAIDVVAHPARYRDKERTLAVLERATGVEVYTSRHRGEIAAEYRAFAEKRRKLWTSSSDDHQNAAYALPPCGTPVHTLERILHRTLPIDLICAE
jgi:hypothetical protein